MKELSIEEKAKRYDEAIEKARIWKDKSGMPKDKQGILDDIFPELRESEDERIKSAAIEFVIQNHSFNYYLGISKDDVVTWIEKQCGQKLVWSEEDKNMLKWVIGYLENKMLNTPISEERIACKNAIAWLLEKQAQKPVDKVEPKFKVGDWISGYYTNYKVLSVNNNGYVVEDVDGNKINILFENEKFHHLWTIQDAKDGDVLAVEPIEEYPSPFVAIYKKQNGEDFDSYCFVGFDGEFYEGENGHSTEEIHPATKEQRDTLEKVMADAGYTFDFEKKELKKIEQKPAAWSKKDARLLDNCISLIEDIDCTEKEQNWLKSIKDRIQPQLQWSEEDERMCKAVIDNIKAICKEGYFVGDIGSDKLIKYLKSLKYRVQPQSHWKPSEQDILLLERIFDGKLDPRGFQASLLNIIRQLKNLREELL